MRATFLQGQDARIITSREIIASVSQSSLKENLGIDASVGGNALTIAMTRKDGSTDANEINPIRYATRGTVEADGDFDINEVTALSDLVISSGSTLGTTSGKDEFIYLYAMGGAGAGEIAASLSFFADGTLQTTVAEGGAGAADNAGVLYSTTLRAGVPITLVARLKSNQATAGLWASAILEVQLNWSPRYTLGSKQVFTSGVTWTKPDGCSAIFVEVVGGGGGGRSVTSNGGDSQGGGGGGGGGVTRAFITSGLGATETFAVGAGGAANTPGGSSTFKGLTALGGIQGNSSASTTGFATGTGGAGGTSSGGEDNIQGGGGRAAIVYNGSAGDVTGGAGGMVPGFGGPGVETGNGNSGGRASQLYGGGGGGASSVNGSGESGAAGANGIIIIWEFY